MSELSIQDAILLRQQIERCYGINDAALEHLDVPVNDVIAITTPTGKLALKLYNAASRSASDVQWEVDLIVHLRKHGAPVVKPLAGPDGYVESFLLGGHERVGALFAWAPGARPERGQDTYALMGKAAAHIHRAADMFTSSLPRHQYDYTAQVLIDEQIQRMQKHLLQVGRWQEMLALGARLKKLIANPALDRGICHIDLTLGNVYREGDTLTVFDFDSAGVCWRAFEPYGVLRVSREYLGDWLEGYRSVRIFSRDDEDAVAAFAIIADLRVTAWKLGVAQSSRGMPLLTAADLPGVVDDWLSWEQEHT
jgi:Ser/Thr protein kinase RdoA (MazF antagonist)